MAAVGEGIATDEGHGQVDLQSPVARAQRGSHDGDAVATTMAGDELLASTAIDIASDAGAAGAASVTDSELAAERGDDVSELGGGAARSKGGRPRLRRRRKKRAAKQSDSEALAAMLGMSKSVAASSVAGGSSFGGSLLDGDGRSVVSNATSVTRGGSSVLDPGPVGRRIEAAMQFSFDASVVKVTNVSHWFHMVSLMGNRNVRLRKVSCSETSKLWTAQIMTMQVGRVCVYFVLWVRLYLCLCVRLCAVLEDPARTDCSRLCAVGAHVDGGCVCVGPDGREYGADAPEAVHNRQHVQVGNQGAEGVRRSRHTAR